MAFKGAPKIVMEEELTHDGANDSDEDETQVCARCMRLVSASTYYCPHCGNAVNTLTPYLPFVNIPFYANFCGALWRATTEPDTTASRQAVSFLVLLICTPLVFLVLLAKVFGCVLSLGRGLLPSNKPVSKG